MQIEKNISINGKHKKPVLIDMFYLKNNEQKNIVVFCHGYKGYKDWGAWNLVAKEFAKNNIFFIKINFSHNGGTINQPIDFPDLEAFGNNNFIKELDDIDDVLDWILQNNSIQNEINTKSISLIGHSRGGGTALIKANENKKITKVISWAGVSDFGSRFPTGKILQKWRDNGVAYITNVRTNQEMPHYFQFYTNFKENEDRLYIKKAVENLDIPYLIIHGTNDETVLLQEAKNLNSWNSNNLLYIIEDANHGFDSKQPWKNSSLPNDLDNVVQKTIQFIIS
ncbi:MAG: prolyl oligopeptidase family serine peptidase [Flavobacteriaceae bacterium]|nr:prolyl oligopeptidase family serine peptidase [Flavobacteriaceae bacterium]